MFSNSVTTSGLYPWGYAFDTGDTFSGSVEVTAANSLSQWQGAWLTVTRDIVAPVVTVIAPAKATSGVIPVSWNATDGLSGPTGVYTVSVMTDTGSLQVWLGNTPLTSANFAGELGHTYTFVVTATDHVSNTGQVTTTTYAVQATKYYYLGSSRVAMRHGTSTGSEVTYLHVDHLGTVSIATNQSQVVLARTLNLPYGGVRWTSSVMPTDYGYTGQKEPVGTGLVYLHARYYAPWVGRIVSPDLIVPNSADPQAWNRYTYVSNSPLRFTDPSGRCIFGLDTLVCAIVAAAIGAGVGYVAGTAIEAEKTPPITVPRVEPPTSRDMTEWLINQMRTNAESPVTQAMHRNFDVGVSAENVAATKAWVALVQPDAIWDFKTDILQANITQNDLVILGGRELNYQSVANIHFGYVGRAAGMIGVVLEVGAGAAQLKWLTKDISKVGPLATNFDQPFDNWSVRFGIFLFERYGLNPDGLTPEAFANALDEFIQNNPSPQPSP